MTFIFLLLYLLLYTACAIYLFWNTVGLAEVSSVGCGQTGALVVSTVWRWFDNCLYCCWPMLMLLLCVLYGHICIANSSVCKYAYLWAISVTSLKCPQITLFQPPHVPSPHGTTRLLGCGQLQECFDSVCGIPCICGVLSLVLFYLFSYYIYFLFFSFLVSKLEILLYILLLHSQALLLDVVLIVLFLYILLSFETILLVIGQLVWLTY